MPYLGRELTSGNYLKLDSLESQFNGSTTTFSLKSGGADFFPGSSLSLLVSIAGVILEADTSFTINNNEITFTTAPANGADGLNTSNGAKAGNGGIGTVNTLLTTTQASAASVGEVDGSNVYYGGGGGASYWSSTSSTQGVGGKGGGVDGIYDSTPNAGAANTGGGGGGRAGTGISQAGGAGGSGVVILKYPSNYTIGGGSGLTIHTPSSPLSGYTLKVFTAGTGTVSFS